MPLNRVSFLGSSFCRLPSDGFSAWVQLHGCCAAAFASRKAFRGLRRFQIARFATTCIHTHSLSYYQEALKNLTRFTASGRLVFLMALLQTLPQEVHDIDDLALLFGPWRGFRRFSGLGLTRLDLLVDQLQEILMIFVPILLGIPRARHRIDQLFCHLELLF